MSLRAGGVLLIAFTSLVALAQAPADTGTPPKLSFGASVDYCSRYVWRGIPFSGGAVLQPSAIAGYGGLSFSVWGNFVLGSEANRHQFNEVDYILSYEKSWGSFTLIPALQLYTFPNQLGVPSTGEFSLALSYTAGDFTFSAIQYVDYLEYSGAYFAQVGAAYGKEVAPALTFSASVWAGWGSGKFNKAYLSVDESALNSAGLDVGLEWRPREWVSLRPHVGGSRILDGALAAQVPDRDNWVAGLLLSLEF